MANEAMDRVGMALDLVGGPELLSELRQVRTEMQAIASLGSQIPRGNGVSGARTYSDPNQPSLDFNKGQKGEQLSMFRELEQGQSHLTQTYVNESNKRIKQNSLETQKTLEDLNRIRKAQLEITEKELTGKGLQKSRNATVNQTLSSNEARDVNRALLDREGIQARINRNAAEYQQRNKDAAQIEAQRFENSRKQQEYLTQQNRRRNEELQKQVALEKESLQMQVRNIADNTKFDPAKVQRQLSLLTESRRADARLGTDLYRTDNADLRKQMVPQALALREYNNQQRFVRQEEARQAEEAQRKADLNNRINARGAAQSGLQSQLDREGSARVRLDQEARRRANLQRVADEEAAIERERLLRDADRIRPNARIKSNIDARIRTINTSVSRGNELEDFGRNGVLRNYKGQEETVRVYDAIKQGQVSIDVLGSIAKRNQSIVTQDEKIRSKAETEAAKITAQSRLVFEGPDVPEGVRRVNEAQALQEKLRNQQLERENKLRYSNQLRSIEVGPPVPDSIRRVNAAQDLQEKLRNQQLTKEDKLRYSNQLKSLEVGPSVPDSIRRINERDKLFIETRESMYKRLERDTAQFNLQGFQGPARPFNVRRSGNGGRGNSGGPGGPNRPNGPAPDFEPNEGAINPRGFFTSLDAVGRITRNILIYKAISTATYGLSEYVGEALQAAKATVEYGNALRFATEQSHGNLSTNLALADSLQGIGLSRQEGRKAVTEAARFTEGRPQDTGRLVQIATDIAAERGLGIDKTDELIEQLRRRESKFFKRIFGTTVEGIYETEAAKTVDSRAQVPTSLLIGVKSSDIKSRSEQIKELVRNMDDTQKEQAVLNYVLSQGNKFQGEAALRSQTLAGRMDRVSAAIKNSQENVGLFITDLRTFNSLMEGSASRAGLLNSILQKPELRRTGPGGTITDSDVQQYGYEATTGSRAKALKFVDDTLVPTALTTVGTLGVALLGRKTANRDAKLAAYFEQLNKSLDAGIPRADAMARAEQYAKAQSAGLVRSVNDGVKRIGTVLQSSVTGTIGAFSEYQGARAKYLFERGQLAPSTVKVAEGPFTPLGKGFFDKGTRDRVSRGAAVGAGYGGLAGGATGGTLGYLIAEKLEVGPMAATTLTITGGIIGNIIGEGIGSVAGAAATSTMIAAGGFGGVLAGGVGASGIIGAGLVAGAGILGVSVGSGLATPVGRILGTNYYKNQVDQQRDDEQLAQLGASNSAYSQKAKEERQAYEEGRIRFALRGSGTGYSNLTGRDVNDLIARSKGQFNASMFDRYAIPSSGEGSIEGLGQKYQQEIENILGEGKTRVGNIVPNLYNDRAFKDVNVTGVDTDLRKSLNAAKTFKEAMQIFKEAGYLEPKNTGDIDSVTRRKLNSVEAKRDDDILSYFVGSKNREEARANFAQSDIERRALEKQHEQELLNQQNTALGKLRETQRGSFQSVNDVATLTSGPDNKYTEILANQVTLADRMKQQWGFLGESAVDYFTKLHQGALEMQLLGTRFDSYITASNLRFQAGRELIERGGPGLTRREQDQIDVTNAQTQQGVGAIDLLAKYRAFRGDRVSRTGLLKEDVGLVTRGLSLGSVGPDGRPVLSGFGELSSEARLRASGPVADALIDVFGNFSKREINQSGMRDVLFRALNTKNALNYLNINDARRKQELGLNLDSQLAGQLGEDQRYRDSELSRVGGLNLDQETRDRLTRNIGERSDKLYLARTDNIPIKDLSFDQFQNRQTALQREADRETARQQEAEAAVKAGLALQSAMLENIALIREAIVGGDLSMLVQVQNDTQAAIDQSSLEQAHSGRYNLNVPLDQSKTKTRPYTDLNEVYSPGQNK
jgi:hypothetical protein